MDFMFPYWAVKKDSDIVLYGEGNVGKDFFLQLYETKYCNVVAWVDKVFDGYELSKPFDYVSNIKNYNVDYIVLAVKDKKTADEISNELKLKCGVDGSKIIWSNYYNFSRDFFPSDRLLYLKDLDFYMSLLDEYMVAETFYATKEYYQSFEKLGIKGSRKNAERLVKYGIHEFLNKDDNVLDIGCNCGFFSMTVAPYVKKIIGVDVDENFINIANKAMAFAKIDNAEFYVKDVFADGLNGNYDAIFMLALPANIGVYEKANVIANHITQGGYLFLESHNMKGESEKYLFKKLIDTYIEKGLKNVCLYDNLGSQDRDFCVLRK